MRAWRGVAIGLAVFAIAAAPASAQLPPLPPIGQPPPPGQPQPAPEPSQPAQPAPVGQAPGTVSLHADAAQAGFVADDALVPPLKQRWSVEQRATQLLAAEGKVFLIGQNVVALDQGDGRQLWVAALASTSLGAAYDRGTVFVNSGGQVRAINAQTGAERWVAKVESFDGLVAGGGAVYVYANSHIYAFRGEDGQPLWDANAPSGGFVPALDDGRVYVAGACARAAAYDRRDGAQVWSRSSGCSGGGSVTPSLSAGKLWVNDGDHDGRTHLDPPILDAASGALVRRWPGGRPVFVDGLAVFSGAGTTAVDAATGAQAWTSKPVLTGATAVGHDVYGVATIVDEDPGSGGRVVSLDSETGQEIWSEKLPGGFHNGSQYIVGETAAAPGLLIVAGGGFVTAYESVFKPPADGIEIGADTFDVIAGKGFSLGGVLGSGIRGGRPMVQLDGAAWRRGDFKRLGEVKPARDGGFTGGITLNRNSRFRVTAGGVASPPITVYAEPNVRIGAARAAGRRISVGVTVRTPGTRLGRRRFVLYLDRARTKRLTRIASGRLRPAGRGRARATLVFTPLRRVGRRDLLAFCIRGQMDLGLGRPSALTRRCGARVVPE